MDRWIIPLAVMGAVVIVSLLIGRLVTRLTGRTPRLPNTGRLLVGAGTGLAVLATGTAFDPDLPWLMVIAGSAAAFISLVAQGFSGKPAR